MRKSVVSRWVRSTALALGIVGITCAVAQAQSDRLRHFITVSISPDGSRLVSTELDDPPPGEGAVKRLVLRRVADGRATIVELPCGRVPECSPSYPVWSPDGRRVAFALRKPGTHARSIYAVDVDAAEKGDAPIELAAFDGTVAGLRYAPDGQLALLGIPGAAREGGASQAGTIAPAGAAASSPEQRIGRVQAGRIDWVSPPDLFVYEFDWMPDGRGFVGTASPGDGDAHWWTAKLYAFAPGSARVLFAPSDRMLQMAIPRVSPDGKRVSFIGGLMSDFDNVGGDAWVMALDRPDAAPVNLTKGAPVSVTSLVWGCGSSELIAGTLAGARSRVESLDAAGGPSRVLSDGVDVLNADGVAVSLACPPGASDATTAVAATVHQTFERAPEIEVGRLGAWRDVTSDNAAVAPPVRARSLDWTSDGLTIQGWLLTPPGGTAPKGTILVAHGGPAFATMPFFLGPSTNRRLIEHGYALFLPNPRGSYGQGEAFTRANVDDFGGGDLRDVLRGLDVVLADPQLTSGRVGITGTSYGGFLTMRAVTRTPRFAAAVARAGISDWPSYAEQNGIGDWLVPYFGATAADAPDRYARASPLADAASVTTPTLALAGAQDIEVPPSQSRLFVDALRAHGVMSDVVIYAGEGHVFSQPANVEDAARRTVAWFDSHLK